MNIFKNIQGHILSKWQSTYLTNKTNNIHFYLIGKTIYKQDQANR